MRSKKKRVVESLNKGVFVCLLALFVVGGCSTELYRDSGQDALQMEGSRQLVLEDLSSDGRETVVLLHGLGRSRVSLYFLARKIRQAGYQTLNFAYNPMTESLEEIKSRLLKCLHEEVTTPRFHLVGHSLGSIVIRTIATADVKSTFGGRWGRIVMLAPPNQVADLAETFQENVLYRWIGGDSGQKLASREFYDQLPVPSTEFGVIAGSRGQRMTFDEPNDGIITVASTRLEGMTDWIVLRHSHTFLMNSRDTQWQVLHFLRYGAFDHGKKR